MHPQQPEYIWREYSSVTNPPHQQLDGWEELLVFTDTYVYHWVETGFDGHPILLPRNPDTIISKP